MRPKREGRALDRHIMVEGKGEYVDDAGEVVERRISSRGSQVDVEERVIFGVLCTIPLYSARYLLTCFFSCMYLFAVVLLSSLVL